MQTNLTSGSPNFNRTMARLAIPIVLQNLVTTAVSSADVIMLGFISQDALAAQYWGRQDTQTIEQIMGIGMRLSILVSTAFFILACFSPSLLMRIFTNEERIIATGIPYLRVVSFSYLFMSISQVYLCTMRAIERVIIRHCG